MAKKSELQNLKEENQKLKDQIDELEDFLRRTQAEFQNYQKRQEKELDQIKSRAAENIIKAQLGILDNFELALKNNKEKSEFSKGIELIYAQLISVLEDFNLKKIPTQNFDANKHEVILIEEGNEDKIEELQPGYELAGKVLRHTKVKLIKKGDEK